MPQPAKRSTASSTVEDELSALERLCSEMERALAGRDWRTLRRTFADTRRIMHALRNAREAAGGERDAELDRRVDARLRRVHAVREDQLRRLRRYRDTISERLQTIAKFRSFARAIGVKRGVSRARLIDDVR